MMTSFPAAAAAASSTIAAQSAGAEAQALPPSLVFSETASSAPLVLMELTPALQQALAATGRYAQEILLVRPQRGSSSATLRAGEDEWTSLRQF